MKLKTITLLLVFLSTFAFSQKTILKEYKSQHLQETRHISIHLPKNYEKDSLANYPLTFVLDSKKTFNLYVQASDSFVLTDNAPKQIIIGVPTSAKDASFNKKNGDLTSQSTWFYLFLRDELLPYIEENYRTSPFITAVGSENSGNLITYFLGEQTPILNAFICLNPNLSDNITNYIDSYRLEDYGKMDNTFYFHISNNANNSKIKQREINNFATYLSELNIPNFKTTFDNIESSTTTTKGITKENISKSITAVFEAYSSISQEEFNSQLKDLSPPEAIAYVENKYIEMNYLFGIDMKIRDRDIVTIENIVIEKEEGYYLKDFGEFLLQVKPDSPLGNFYIGKHYEIAENRGKCLEHYQTAYTKIDASDKVSADKFYKNNILRVLAER